jgi:hypothetical protein
VKIKKVRKRLEEVKGEATNEVRWGKEDKRPDDLCKIEDAASMFGKAAPSLMIHIRNKKVRVWKPDPEMNNARGGRRLQFLVSPSEIGKALNWKLKENPIAELSRAIDGLEERVSEVRAAFRAFRASRKKKKSE